jgi:hypothetical protein
MKMFVAASGLNLRDHAPRGGVIAVLPCAQPVTVISADQSGWLTVETADPRDRSKRISGVVAERFLRPPLPGARDALVAAALAEWRRFDYGAGREGDAPYKHHIREMWSALGFSDRNGGDHGFPWSAAAISWIVRQAAAQIPALDDFAYGEGHWRYVKDAIKRREAGLTAPFWGRRINEAPARIGDMVVRGRAGGPGFTCVNVASYEAARDCPGSFASHCDLIIGLSFSRAHAIGGNIRNSVSLTSFDLDDEGCLEAKDGVFMLLQCQL